MIIEFDIPFDSPEARKQCATRLGRLVSVNDIEPYKPNEDDDLYWTIDSGNDWKVKFFADNPKRVQIRFRYNRPERDLETPLSNWIMARWGGKMIEGPSVYGPFMPRIASS
jgi:hypothetical protein